MTEIYRDENVTVTKDEGGYTLTFSGDYWVWFQAEVALAMAKAIVKSEGE